MKEYIFQLDNVAADNDIVVANAPAGLTVKNILAIINKTTGNPVHSPIALVVDSVTYNGTTMTITLDSNAPSIEGDLLIKAYSDEDSGGGGEDLEPATDAEYAAFKTHMQTEIANILTPITEEEE